MKKVCISVLILLSFGVSLYFYSESIEFDETRYGNKGVILWSMPLTMCLVSSNLLVLPILLKSQAIYARYKKGMESIFLAVTIILFILHIGLILVATGTEFNLLLLVPISVGIVLITTANTLPRFKVEINQTSSEFTQSTNQMWNIMIRPFSKPLFIGGAIMLLCIFLPENLMLIGFFTILFCTIVVSIYLSYRAYQAYAKNT